VYPDYRRAVPDEAGVWRVPDARLARRHRSNIGTIASGREHLRLACFSVEAHCAVLPAFGEFTGGMTVAQQAGRILYAVGGQAVWRLPSGR
jgi:hypothetical protein